MTDPSSIFTGHGALTWNTTLHQLLHGRSHVFECITLKFLINRHYFAFPYLSLNHVTVTVMPYNPQFGNFIQNILSKTAWKKRKICVISFLQPEILRLVWGTAPSPLGFVDLKPNGRAMDKSKARPHICNRAVMHCLATLHERGGTSWAADWAVSTGTSVARNAEAEHLEIMEFLLSPITLTAVWRSNGAPDPVLIFVRGFTVVVACAACIRTIDDMLQWVSLLRTTPLDYTCIFDDLQKWRRSYSGVSYIDY